MDDHHVTSSVQELYMRLYNKLSKDIDYADQISQSKFKNSEAQCNQGESSEANLQQSDHETEPPPNKADSCGPIESVDSEIDNIDVASQSKESDESLMVGENGQSLVVNGNQSVEELPEMGVNNSRDQMQLNEKEEESSKEILAQVSSDGNQSEGESTHEFFNDICALKSTGSQNLNNESKVNGEIDHNPKMQLKISNPSVSGDISACTVQLNEAEGESGQSTSVQMPECNEVVQQMSENRKSQPMIEVHSCNTPEALDITMYPKDVHEERTQKPEDESVILTDDQSLNSVQIENDDNYGMNTQVDPCYVYILSPDGQKLIPQKHEFTVANCDLKSTKGQPIRNTDLSCTDSSEYKIHWFAILVDANHQKSSSINAQDLLCRTTICNDKEVGQIGNKESEFTHQSTYNEVIIEEEHPSIKAKFVKPKKTYQKKSVKKDVKRLQKSNKKKRRNKKKEVDKTFKASISSLPTTGANINKYSLKITLLKSDILNCMWFLILIAN